jgi:hypothetical protein
MRIAALAALPRARSSEIAAVGWDFGDRGSSDNGYSVDHRVTHHVEGELRPNFIGATYARRYQVEEDRLVLSSANPNEPWRVVWDRVKRNPKTD